MHILTGCQWLPRNYISCLLWNCKYIAVDYNKIWKKKSTHSYTGICIIDCIVAVAQRNIFEKLMSLKSSTDLSYMFWFQHTKQQMFGCSSVSFDKQNREKLFLVHIMTHYLKSNDADIFVL